ncbi:sensor histidine kinase [Paenibacillus azoreducens]|uniref:histidine kinase n=1 Tax=Paenibacillus azoreducens TaxID=116718 RepID=A0A919YCR9_9BACL|nr:HAMP domain-containing sensor histidine kinase [Paenibacillus azoreducens]GIO48827.1 hypothetical protein J34TS1_35920 [Paenibacillus azoreducens]
MKSKPSIRQWLIIILLLLTCIPFLGTKLAAHLYHQYAQPTQTQDPALHGSINDQDWIEKAVLTKPELWNDKEWGSKIEADLANKGIALILLDSKHQPVFTNAKISDEAIVHEKESYRIQISKSAFEQQDIRRDGKYVGTALIRYRPPHAAGVSNDPKMMSIEEWGGIIVWISLFLLVLLGCAIITNRTILRPLHLLEQAALLFSRKQFTAKLPSSPVKEINEVANGFQFMQQELQKLSVSQTQMEEDRKMFIASIVHDLRTPIFSIRGYLEGLERGVAQTPDKQKKYIEICKQKAELLEELVFNLFQYVKLDFLGIKPTFQNVEIEGLIQTVMDGYALDFGKKDIASTLDISDRPIMVQGSSFLLTRAIDNLISNALRHTPNKGSVTIVLKKNVDEITITIQDSGEGIPEDVLPHIFKPLYRGEHSRNRKTGGAGLGLTIARQIFVLHGGDLTAANGPEGGAVFVGRIPIR